MRRSHVTAILPLLLLPRLASPQGEPLGPEFRVNTVVPFSQGRSSAASIAGDFVVVWTGQFADGYGVGGPGIVGQRFDSAGNPLGVEFRVNTYTPGPQLRPAVGANASGTFVVVWDYGYSCAPPCPPPTGYKVFGQRFAASGVPLGPEFVVSPTGASYQRYPEVAVAPSGAFLVIWRAQFSQAPPGPADVFARRYDSSGVPQGPEFRVNAYTTGEQIAGSVTADRAGDFVVVWTSQYYGSNGYDVVGQRYAPSGEPLGPQFRVNTYAPGDQTDPGMATDPFGNFVVAWSSESSGNPPAPGLFGQRFAPGAVPIGSEFRINTDPTGTQDQPAIAFDGGGNFVISWHAPSIGTGEVFGQRYSSTGVPSGPEFRVNTTTGGWQRNPSVASNPGGIFLVTWDSGPPGLIPEDVFGQRFGGVFPVELQDFRLK